MEGTEGTVDRYEDFKRVCVDNLIVQSILRSGGSIYDCIVALDKNQEKLIDKIVQLKMIVPRKITSPDCKTYIWRCPEELIPEESFPFSKDIVKEENEDKNE